MKLLELSFAKEINHRKIWMRSMVGMSIGFFGTLIIGSIFSLIGSYSSSNIFVSMNELAKMVTPIGIGLAIGVSLGFNATSSLAIGVCAMIAAKSMLIPRYLNDSIVYDQISIDLNLSRGYIGDVFAAWIASVLLIYFFHFVKIDGGFSFIIIPVFGIAFGLVSALSLTYLTSLIVVYVEWLVAKMSNTNFLLSILFAPIIGAMMGMALSLPISSAAIAQALHLDDAAAVAALAGTVAQMISFGILTYWSSNSWSKTIAVALGTSMLHMENYVKRPAILIIPTFASALAALLSVISFNDIFEFSQNYSLSGMGSSLLYGPIELLRINGWGNYLVWIEVGVIHIAFTFLFTIGAIAIFKKRDWIRKEWLDLKWSNLVPSTSSKPAK